MSNETLEITTSSLQHQVQVPAITTTLSPRAAGASLHHNPFPTGLPELTDRESMCAALEAEGLRPSNAARMAGLNWAQYRVAIAKPAYKTLIRSILSSAATEANAAAIATRAGRLARVSSSWEDTKEIIRQRAVSASPRCLNPDPEYIASLGFSHEVLRSQYPDLGVDYDPSDPACQNVDPSSFDVPGASTGMLVKTLKSIGSGQNARTVVEWTVDESLMRILASLEKQAALETGQDKEKGGVQKLWVGIDIDEL